MTTATSCLPPPVQLLGVDSILATVDASLTDRDLTVVVLFGKPGRGKTSLGELIGRTRGSFFQEINASSERRGSDLRDHLSRFVSDGNQTALRSRLRGGQTGSLASRPLGVLLLDEADGLGSVGQSTVASFVAELEEKELPAAGGWRACVILSCNTLGALHDSVISRAHVLAEMPRPSIDTLITVARAWVAANAAATGASPPPNMPDAPALAKLAARADGDFRAMHQLLTLSVWGGDDTAADELLVSGDSTLGPTRCPRDLARLLLRGEGAHDLLLWDRLWKMGYRSDDVVLWIEQAVGDPHVSAEWRRKLVGFHNELIARETPKTLLQLIGSFARHMVVESRRT
jgi:hypothetical protein